MNKQMHTTYYKLYMFSIFNLKALEQIGKKGAKKWLHLDQKNSKNIRINWQQSRELLMKRVKKENRFNLLLFVILVDSNNKG